MAPWCDELEADLQRCIFLFEAMDSFACHPWPVGSKRRTARGKHFAQHATRISRMVPLRWWMLFPV